MKKNNKYIKTIMLGAILCSFGCKKITDINHSPNNPPLDKATPQVLFPSAVQSTAGRVGGELAIVGGIWAQYWTQSNASNQFKSIDAYNLQKNDFQGSYTELFAGALNDYQLTITQAKTNSQLQYYLMATVMKAYTYEVLVDLYDQVPYTEALQGAAIVQPKFNDGYTVYKGLIAEIDAAMAATASTSDLAAADQKTDFVFNGSMAKWRQFANTLELKMYLRMVNTKAADAQTGINNLYAAGGDFLTVDAQTTTYADVLDQANPLYDYNARLNIASNLRASKTFTSWLTNNNDPRTISYFGTAAPTPQNQGDFNATATQQPTYANATVPVLSHTAPVQFISKAESYFMQAEALERYKGGVGASVAYTAGLNAAFAQYGQTAPTIGVYVYPTAGTFDAKLKTIIMQKWASFPGSHALEGFFEQERTGYPHHSPVYSTVTTVTTAGIVTVKGYVDFYAGDWVYSANGVTAGKFPKRMVFPDAEDSRNTNTPAQVPLTTPVWWGLTTDTVDN